MPASKVIVDGLPYSNVVGTGTATNQISTGRTLENLILKIGGTTMSKALMTSIKVKANGKVILEGSGEQIDKINAYRGVATNASYLEIPFADRSMLSHLDRQCSAFDMSRDLGIGHVSTEVKIEGADAPTLKPINVQSAQQKQRDGSFAPYAPLIGKILSYPFGVATGGTLPVTVPFGEVNGSLIKRLHVFHSGNMTGATVKEDGMVIFEALTGENEFRQTQFGRTPQANMFTFDFVLDGTIAGALNTKKAKSLEWLMDFSAADSGTILVEYLDEYSNL